MPCINTDDDIDYVAVGLALRSMSPQKRKAVAEVLQIMADKRKTTAAWIVALLVFAFVFIVAAAAGQNPWIVFGAAAAGGAITLLLVLAVLKLL